MRTILKYGFGVGMSTKERVGWGLTSSAVGFILGIFIYNAGALGSYKEAIKYTWIDLKKIKKEVCKLF